MNPFFQDESNAVYHGNALTILPCLPFESIDAVITDPPYYSGAVSLSGKQADPVVKYQKTGTKKGYPSMLGDAKDQRSFTWWMTQWLCECWRIARDGAPLLVFTDWRQLPSVTDAVQAAGWMWRGLVVWHKPRPVLCPVSSGVTPSISSMAPRDVFSGTQANACPAFSGIR